MITSQLPDAAEESGSPLSEESEREILAMVEEQLDRPNPPDTKVLYRRAMHFVDRDVRRLSLQQFNAKFPLQVKRRRARERDGAGSGGNGNGSAAAEGGDGDRSREDGEELRGRMRTALLEYAKSVAGAGTEAEFIDAVRRVDDYVERVTGG